MAEIDRLRSGRIFTLSWILFWSITAKADQIEDLTLNGLGAEANHLLIYNPAASYSGKRMISALAYLGNRNSSVIASPQNGAQKIDYENEIKGTGAAFSIPLGGASFGLHFFELREELKAQNDTIQRTIEELQVSKDYAFRFIVELSGNIRGGFLYQVKAIENDIFGSFFVNGNDRTVFKGQMAGYRLGVFMRNLNTLEESIQPQRYEVKELLRENKKY